MKTLAIDLIEEYTYLEHMNNPFEGQELNTAHTFALTTTTHNGGRIFLFGFPRKGNKFWNIISAFPPLLWALFLASAIVYAGMFVTIRFVYQRMPANERLLKKGIGNWDVVIQVTATLTEPQGLDSFPRWSTGMCLNFYTTKRSSVGLHECLR